MAKVIKGKEVVAMMRVNMSCFIFHFARLTVTLRLATATLIAGLG